MPKFTLLLVLLGVLPLGAQQELLRTDAQLRGGQWSGTVTIPGAEGLRLGVSAASVDFFPKVTLTLPDGSRKEVDPVQGYARISLFIPVKGPVGIQVSSTGGKDNGRFTVQALALPVLPALRLPMEKEGTLTAESTDWDGEGRRIHWYPLPLKKGDRVSLSLESEFDNYLTVETPTGEVLSNDDAQGSNAGLSFRAVQDGVYQVGASSYDSSNMGGYTLKVERGPEPRPVTLGRVVRGTLDEEDPIAGERRGDLYSVPLKPGVRYEAVLDSEDFDTYLLLVTPEGTKIEDDDSGEENNALIRFSSPAGGSADIIASGSSSDAQGRYILLVRELPPPTPLPLNSPVQGAVEEEDETLSEGGRGDIYGFTASPGQVYRIRTQDADFDTVLTVTGPEGIRYKNDDISGDDTESQLVFLSPAGGQVYVEVSSAVEDEGGNYRLLLATAPEKLQAYRPDQLLGPGTPVVSYKKTEDQYHTYKFSIPSDRVGILRLESFSFDPVLQVATPSGESLENDDGPFGTHSELEIRGETGDFTLQVKALEEEESSQTAGLYRLSLELKPRGRK